MQRQELNIPLILTGVRLLSPLVLPLLIVSLWPLHNDFIHIFLVIIFLLLGLTDLFDGLLARHWQQETKIGRLLDPIADKFLIISSLIALQAVGALNFVWVIILVLREMFIMAVRYIACEHSVTIEVSQLAKIKTWLQIALVAYLLSPYGYLDSWTQFFIYLILLLTTIACSLYSAYHYYQLCMVGVYGKDVF